MTLGIAKPILYVFADANVKAYGAVAYFCEGEQSAFVMARTHVVPLRAYGSGHCYKVSYIYPVFNGALTRLFKHSIVE